MPKLFETLQKDEKFAKEISQSSQKAMANPFFQRVMKEALLSDSSLALGKVHDAVVEAALPELVGRELVQIIETEEPFLRIFKAKKGKAYRSAQLSTTWVTGESYDILALIVVRLQFESQACFLSFCEVEILMLKTELVLKGESVQEFKKALISMSEPTAVLYTKRLYYFFRWAGIRPDDLIRRGRRNRKYVESILSRYFETRLKAACPSTVANDKNAIKLFLEMNDITNLNWRKLKLPKFRRYGNDRAYKLEEIRALTSDIPLQFKCSILLMASSGIRLGALDYLNYGHIQPIYRDDRSLRAAMIKVYSGDVEEYQTFCTPECYEELKKYIEFRERHSEVITSSSPLIRNEFNTRLKDGAKDPGRCKSPSIGRAIDRLLHQKGLRTKYGSRLGERQEFQSAHGLRKFFKTRCEQVMKSIYVELLMGHKVGVMNSYMKPSFDELLNEYEKAIPLLTINEAVQLKRKYQEMEKAQIEQELRIYKLEEEIKELARRLKPLGE